ncbi:MAG: aminopeptidase P family protein [Rhizobiales bacterium]|nr:aminopeptidase P family protein [Hyphomicrobiales bacterium]
MTPINRFHPIGFDRAKLAATLRREGMRAVLLSSPENVYYTTGYTALPSAGNPILYMLRNRLPFFSLVEDTGRVTLLCWDFSAWNMDFGVDEIVGYADLAGALAAVRDLVGAKVGAAERLGVESSLPYNILQVVAPLVSSDRLVVADRALDTVRLIKTPAEIACLQRGVDIIEKTCGELFDILRVGMGRNELTHEAKKRLIANGADGISHLTFSFALANPEFDIDEVLEPGKLVTLDLGAIYRGYCSDNRRYALAGPVPAHIGDLYKRMVGIVDGVG